MQGIQTTVRVKKGSTSVSLYFMVDAVATSYGTIGDPYTGAFTAGSCGRAYTKNRAATDAAGCTGLTNGGSAWYDTGMVAVDTTNAPGLVRVDYPNAAFDTAGTVICHFIPDAGKPAAIAVDVYENTEQDILAVIGGATGINAGDATLFGNLKSIAGDNFDSNDRLTYIGTLITANQEIAAMIGQTGSLGGGAATLFGNLASIAGTGFTGAHDSLRGINVGGGSTNLASRVSSVLDNSWTIIGQGNTALTRIGGTTGINAGDATLFGNLKSIAGNNFDSSDQLTYIGTLISASQEITAMIGQTGSLGSGAATLFGNLASIAGTGFTGIHDSLRGINVGIGGGSTNLASRVSSVLDNSWTIIGQGNTALTRIGGVTGINAGDATLFGNLKSIAGNNFDSSDQLTYIGTLISASQEITAMIGQTGSLGGGAGTLFGNLASIAGTGFTGLLDSLHGMNMGGGSTGISQRIGSPLTTFGFGSVATLAGNIESISGTAWASDDTLHGISLRVGRYDHTDLDASVFGYLNTYAASIMGTGFTGLDSLHNLSVIKIGDSTGINGGAATLFGNLNSIAGVGFTGFDTLHQINMGAGMTGLSPRIGTMRSTPLLTGGANSVVGMLSDIADGHTGAFAAGDDLFSIRGKVVSMLSSGTADSVVSALLHEEIGTIGETGGVHLSATLNGNRVADLLWILGADLWIDYTEKNMYVYRTTKAATDVHRKFELTATSISSSGILQRAVHE